MLETTAQLANCSTIIQTQTGHGAWASQVECREECESRQTYLLNAFHKQLWNG